MYIVKNTRGDEYDEGLYLSELRMDSGSFQKKRCRVLQMRGTADEIDQDVISQVCISG